MWNALIACHLVSPWQNCSWVKTGKTSSQTVTLLQKQFWTSFFSSPLWAVIILFAAKIWVLYDSCIVPKPILYLQWLRLTKIAIKRVTLYRNIWGLLSWNGCLLLKAKHNMWMEWSTPWKCFFGQLPESASQHSVRFCFSSNSKFSKLLQISLPPLQFFSTGIVVVKWKTGV